MAQSGPPLDSPLRCGEQAMLATQTQIDFCTNRFASVWLIEGAGRFSLAGRQWRLQAGDAWHRFPDQVHSFFPSKDCRFLFAALPVSIYQGLQELGLPDLDQPVFHPGLHKHLIRQHRRLRADLPHLPKARRAIYATRLQSWVVDLHAASSTRDALVTTACERLTGAAAHHLALPQLAKELGLTYAALRKRFRQQTGMSLGQYRIRCRLERAQELLSSTQQSIAGIAESLGYADVYRFSSQFRQHCGCSPSAWRRQAG